MFRSHSSDGMVVLKGAAQSVYFFRRVRAIYILPTRRGLPFVLQFVNRLWLILLIHDLLLSSPKNSVKVIVGNESQKLDKIRISHQPVKDSLGCFCRIHAVTLLTRQILNPV